MKTSCLALFAIFLTVTLDMAGIGLVLPVLPDLFGAAKSGATVGMAYGLFLSLYALMQFLCAPLLGGWSDRVGRKPVLTISLIGAALNYAVMACLPPLWVLFVARAIAGITGANMSVAQAYLADISTPEERAKRFGQMNACMGVGFILGPAAGGLLREASLMWPFALAAALTVINLLLCLFVLPESRVTEPTAEKLNPLAPLTSITAFRGIVALLLAGGLFAIIGEIGGSVWVLYVENRYNWQGLTVGVSLTLFGFFHALAQAFLVGPITRRLGERGALLVGVFADMACYVALGVVTKGAFIWVLIPLLSVGGIGPSILMAVISKQVSEDRQGQLQGVIASLQSLAAIIGPVLMLNIYFLSREVFPGLVWIIGAALYLLVLPIVLRRSIYK
ncbi:TCR/Tet family MFS transporter [Asticcacaulis taihuensis]|uniref:MFS transporter, DHA1 family, tetracycline resistance protein n=1 Tax=Asticcacaulis taihuensis TaxID=260084 RepID=A0A1G4Q9J3_9CAUL|nr:TCR/Tet family MFS transporter [Asticcacaulis taihuensis]SCW41008.1 MFS transporter, DHA1 family, tetracycline resistance protein [Asticcacaulis taihuensis]